MKKQLLFAAKIAAVMFLASACTKTRKAELAEDLQTSIFAIGEFGTPSDTSSYSANVSADAATDKSLTPLAVSPDNHNQLHAQEVSVPEKMKFMFDNMPLLNMQTRKFDVTFSVDRNFVTGYRIATDISQLSPVEKLLAVTSKELQINSSMAKAASAQVKALSDSLASAQSEKEKIKNGSAAGILLIPLFKYKIESYGTVVRSKNELKEETAKLELKPTEWKDATHVKITPLSENRLMIGMGAEETQQFRRIFSENRLDNQVMSAEDLQNNLTVGMRFLDPKAQVFTRLDAAVMHVYQILKISDLNENQSRLLKNNAGNEEVISCKDSSVSQFVKSSDNDCVLVLKANIPIAYKKVKLADTDTSGGSSEKVEFEEIPRSKSVGLIEIKENVAAAQADISGSLDPKSALKISDLQGEFYYRRTLEDASNMFLQRTGTSGDMAIVRFELENSRIVVRNQNSLISYTGQGPKDREELMSFPVKYVKMVSMDASGSSLTVPQAQETTKEQAQYAIVDWTKNTVPDSTSPLAFYAGGDCFQATSSLDVTDTDMRLATDGVFNFSLSGSYTVKPQNGCVAQKDVNSAYWAGTSQFNFNVKERISFLKHSDNNDDLQFAPNMSSMAQSAFNFGVFTLADLVTQNGTLPNRDGSEKYMPIIHDFRNNKVLTYHLGGINNSEATSPERRALLVEAAQQVIREWNATLKMAFRGTSLERQGDYVNLIIDDASTETHLGDLDRNYIWFNELPAENGLLGVAQPAANPRSGTIKSANVIIYTGNTFEQTERLLTLNTTYRESEQTIESIKADLVTKFIKEQEAAQKENSQSQADQPTEPSSDSSAGAKASVKKVTAQATYASAVMTKAAKTLNLDNKRINTLLSGLKKHMQTAAMPQHKFSAQLLQNGKGRDIKYDTTSETFMKKLVDLAGQKKFSDNSFEFELAVNDAYLQFGNISPSEKEALQKRSQELMAAVRFNEMTKHRAGCYDFSRTDINQAAMKKLSEDPHQNLMRNFKSTVMSTLSHELGHAFGLLHNFKGSIDKANYKFNNEQTERNYSSIMDYISDIDMSYAGPGPYDLHAVRAAYTGLVEISPKALENKNVSSQIAVSRDNLAQIKDIERAAGIKSEVVLTKDTLNKTGLLKYYEQCDDEGVGKSALCARFDVGGSATEIVQNYIQDYNRGYLGRNYVHNKILFGAPQRAQLNSKNIQLFQNIRSFLDEAIHTLQVGQGLTASQTQIVATDELRASKLGYNFFNELIRQPTSSMSVMRQVLSQDFLDALTEEQLRIFMEKYLDRNEIQAASTKDLQKLAQQLRDNDLKNDTDGDGLVVNEDRFFVAPYKIKDASGQVAIKFQLMERRPLFDIQYNSEVLTIENKKTRGDRDKLDTVGIVNDKVYAMLFLLQSTAAETSDESPKSKISYVNFEEWFMGISDPADSPIMNTISGILSNNLRVGFFPRESIVSSMIEVPRNVQVSLYLGIRTAIGAIVGLEENRYANFDAYAELFKVGKASEKNAPTNRFNVVKAGQTRGQTDTKTYFAGQNSFGADTIISNAARNQYFTENKPQLHKAMLGLYKADAVYRNAIKKIKQDICKDNESSDECTAANAKSDDSYFAENPDLKKAKDDADALANALVAQLRADNKHGLLLEPELDAADSEVNFDLQVATLRKMLASQIDLIKSTLKALAAIKTEEEFKGKFNYFNELLSKQLDTNEQVEAVHLMDSGFNFVSLVAQNMKVETVEGNLTGDVFIAGMMNPSVIEDHLDQQLEVIDKLATFTGMVDPDTILQ